MANEQNALSFAVQQAAHVEAMTQEVEYGDIQFMRMVPVNTEPSDWASSIAFFTADADGRPKWMDTGATQVPTLELKRNLAERSVQTAMLGYGWSLEEINQAMLVGRNLTSEEAMWTMESCLQFLDDVAINGAAEFGWTGLINQPTSGDEAVSRTDAAEQSGTGNLRTWAAKIQDNEHGADDILRDINAGITATYTDTRQRRPANCIGLPPEEFGRIASVRVPDTTQSILNWVRMNNVYTASTGMDLEIFPIRGLENAAPGNANRMVAYRKDPAVMKFHLPMPPRGLPIWQDGPTHFFVPVMMRTGGFELRRTNAMAYIDLI